jgi:outer membrane immunogenic protein
MLRKLALAAAALAVTGSAAMAADLYVPETAAPIVEATGTSFEGFYAGAQLGGYFEENADTQLLIGGVIGYNFASSPIYAGVELQGNYYFENDSFNAASEILALGKIGFTPADNLALYATGGVGYVWEDGGNDFSEFALGVGAEYKVTDDMSIRGDILGIGYDNGGDTFDAARATVGVLWHF